MKTPEFITTELPPRNGLARVHVQWPRGLRGKFYIGRDYRNRAGIQSVFTAHSVQEANLIANEAIDAALLAHVTAEMGVRERTRAMQRHNLKRAS